MVTREAFKFMPDRLPFDVRSSFVSMEGPCGTICLCLAFREESIVDPPGSRRTTDPRCVASMLSESRIEKGSPSKGTRIVATEVSREEDRGWGSDEER